MSCFTNYTQVSKNYDEDRKAAASDVMAALIQTHLNKNLSEVHVCDLGAGTGNYTEAMLKHGVGKISLLDANQEMLEKAKGKIAKLHKTECVHAIVTADLPEIPFDDNTFDAVMINMVLHHLEKSPDRLHFEQAQKTLEQTYRILRPGGILAVTTTTPTLMDSCWYFNLHEDVLQRYKKRFMSITQLQQMLTGSGFKVLNTLNVTGRDIFESYSDLEGPLRSSFRNNVSYFAEATPDELEQIISLVKKLKDSNELQNFYDQHDKSDDIGLFALCISRAVK